MVLTVNLETERLQHLLILCTSSGCIGLVLMLVWDWSHLPAYSVGVALTLQLNSLLQSRWDAQAATQEKARAKAEKKALKEKKQKKKPVC